MAYLYHFHSIDCHGEVPECLDIIDGYTAEEILFQTQDALEGDGISTYVDIYGIIHETWIDQDGENVDIMFGFYFDTQDEVMKLELAANGNEELLRAVQYIKYAIAKTKEDTV